VFLIFSSTHLQLERGGKGSKDGGLPEGEKKKGGEFPSSFHYFYCHDFEGDGRKRKGGLGKKRGICRGGEKREEREESTLSLFTLFPSAWNRKKGGKKRLGRSRRGGEGKKRGGERWRITRILSITLSDMAKTDAPEKKKGGQERGAGL